MIRVFSQNDGRIADVPALRWVCVEPLGGYVRQCIDGRIFYPLSI
ncbi:MAG: hypothetical protein U5L45_22355 [Saprospiraceae bacterium]|nr:hypothetical protein [Saprospiraceae bacterium]